MPGTPKPIVDPVLGVVWGSMKQAAQNQKQATTNLASQAQQGNTYDRWMNTVALSGSNLDQVVTIGAVWGVSGVEVGTNLGTPSAPVAGIAKQENLLTATVTYEGTSKTPTVTAGMTIDPTSLSMATLDASLATAWAGSTGYVIGASDVEGNDVLIPGTYILAISGTSITLSQPAAESSETPLYCAACQFVLL